MKAKKVLFITQEITPYVSETEMSLIGRNLPQAIQEKAKRYVLSCPSGETSTNDATSYTK